MLTRFERFSRWIGGIEKVRGTSLPIEEFVHPWPLLALALLGLNDSILKGAEWLPEWLTGKISDFMGLFFFPSLITAIYDTILFGLFFLTKPRGLDYSLNPRKTYAGCVITCLCFVPPNISEGIAQFYVQTLDTVGLFNLWGTFQITSDPTDLMALVMLVLTVRHHRRLIRRIPIGRLAVIRERTRGLCPNEIQTVLKCRTRDIQRLLVKHPRCRAAFDAFLDSFAPTLHISVTDRQIDMAQKQLDVFRETFH